MKVALVLTSLALLSFNGVHAQDTVDKIGQSSFVYVDVKSVSVGAPLYILKSHDKAVQLSNGPVGSDINSILKTIKNNWIESIYVIKDQDAIDKYGQPGRNGVIIIHLKDGALDKLPADLKERFKAG